MHKNPQRCTKVHGMCPIRHNIDQLVDQSEDIFVEYPVHVISVAVLAAVVEQRIFLIVFNNICCALQKNIFCLSSHIKGQAFSV